MKFALTSSERAGLILSILKDKKAIRTVAIELGCTEAEVQSWVEAFVFGGQAAIDGASKRTRRPGIVLGLAYVFLILCAAVTIIFFICTAIFDWHASADWQEAGQRADFWGGHIAAAGSFAGAFLLFLAIMLQYEELKSHRDELEQTHDEMRRSRVVAETQLQMAKENATFTQIMELVRLSMEAEARILKAEIDQKAKTKEQEEFLARDQHARVEKALKLLFDGKNLSSDASIALQSLSAGAHGEENQ